MLVDVILESPRWETVALGELAERGAQATLAHLGLATDGFEISLLGCNDTRIAELNGEFRAKGQATNVLSWPSEERGAEEGQHPVPPQPHGDPELGDIAIAWETCEREAAEAGKPIEAHVTHLVVHATLHLLGYDHIRDADATLMENLEREILGKLGLPDPYLEHKGV